MDEWQEQEAERQQRQAAWEASADRRLRNRQGQFATPAPLARQIAAATLNLLSSRDSISFLDPALGTGAFHAALLAERGARFVQRATGIELDSELAHIARRVWHGSGLTVRSGDFTRLAAPRPDRRYSLILANPPYVRHHHLAADDKRRLREAVSAQCGLDVSGRCGLYGYFLLLAHQWLSENGAAAWLLPSEWMDVNYGRVLRKYLLENVRLHRLHLFPAEHLQFAGTLVTSTVVMFQRRTSNGNESPVLLTCGESLAQPRQTRRVDAAQLARCEKWNTLLETRRRGTTRGVSLASLFRVRRGLATGSNKFFIGRRDEHRFRQVPSRFLRPILPGPRFVTTDIIEADPRGWPRELLPLVLLDCPLDEPQVRDEYPSLWQYFQEAARSGVAGGYLLRHRRPWFRQEQRPAAPYLCTYMGRRNAARRALRFLWNHSQATAANTYLLLYPRPPLATALRDDLGLQADVFARLQEIDDQQLRREGRLYGGGLQKVEPAELQRATIRVRGLGAIIAATCAAVTK
jgi:adenine-specific DNA-methyltransferase